MSVIRLNASCERDVHSSACSTSLAPIGEHQCRKLFRQVTYPEFAMQVLTPSAPDDGRAIHSSEKLKRPLSRTFRIQIMNGQSRGDILCVLAHVSPACRIFAFETESPKVLPTLLSGLHCFSDDCDRNSGWILILFIASKSSLRPRKRWACFSSSRFPLMYSISNFSLNMTRLDESGCPLLMRNYKIEAAEGSGLVIINMSISCIVESAEQTEPRSWRSLRHY
jgi:hypothetical protein